MINSKLKDGLRVLSSNQDIAEHGKSIMGDAIDGVEQEPCPETIDMFAVLSGPMGRVIK